MWAKAENRDDLYKSCSVWLHVKNLFHMLIFHLVAVYFTLTYSYYCINKPENRNTLDLGLISLYHPPQNVISHKLQLFYKNLDNCSKTILIPHTVLEQCNVIQIFFFTLKICNLDVELEIFRIILTVG